MLMGPLTPLTATAQSLQSAKPWIGVGIEQAKNGVLVTRVLEQTPAAKAGILQGDVIQSVDATQVATPQDLISYITSKGLGYQVTIHFLRKGKAQKKTMALEARPDMERLLKTQLMNNPAPDFKLPIVAGPLTGQSFDLKAHKGSIILLKFWATWCPACKAALPRVAQFANAAKKQKKNLKIVLISSEEGSLLQKAFQGAKVPFEVATAEKHDTERHYYVPALPTFVVIDEKGVVRHTAVGAGIYLDQTLEAVSKLF